MSDAILRKIERRLASIELQLSSLTADISDLNESLEQVKATLSETLSAMRTPPPKQIEAARPEPAKPAAKPYLTREEATEALRVSVRTVDRLLRDGTLKSRRVGRRVFVSSGDIERLIKSA
jgi:excisionase family DNA binding protein